MQNTIMRDIPDSADLKFVKNTPPQECELSQTWCVTSRLCKLQTKASCPILLQFGSITETIHLDDQSLLSNFPTFKKIRIIHDRTFIR